MKLEGEEQILATVEELDTIEKEAKTLVKESQKRAWEAYRKSIDTIQNEALPLVKALSYNPEVEDLLTNSLP